jgi:hypothetical protein
MLRWINYGKSGEVDFRRNVGGSTHRFQAGSTLLRPNVSSATDGEVGQPAPLSSGTCICRRCTSWVEAGVVRERKRKKKPKKTQGNKNRAWTRWRAQVSALAGTPGQCPSLPNPREVSVTVREKNTELITPAVRIRPVPPPGDKICSG